MAAAATSTYRLGLEGLAPVYVKADDIGADFMAHFRDNFKIQIVEEAEDGMTIVFDMVGIDAPVANAIRRILLSEVPTMAIDTVFIYKNTSIIQDEVLAHRLGLIPLRADPRRMNYQDDPDNATDRDTLVFHLEARGELTSAIRAANPAHMASHPSGRPITVDSATYEQAFASEADKEGDVEGRYTKVHASDITWQSHGEQDVMFPAGAEEVASVHPDILVAKLAPGQVIHVEMHAVKGTGKTHAKWSPVSTAWYRLLPRITLSEEEPFYDAEAEDLVRCCPVGVFDIEDIGSGSGSSAEGASTTAAKGKKGSKGSSGSGAGMEVEGPRKRGIVARPRDCTLCRECIRVPERGRRIRLEKISDHFIFCVESTGAMPARDLVTAALDTLREKCERVAAAFDAALATEGRGEMGSAEVARATIAAMRTEPDDLSARY